MTEARTVKKNIIVPSVVMTMLTLATYFMGPALWERIYTNSNLYSEVISLYIAATNSTLANHKHMVFPTFSNLDQIAKDNVIEELTQNASSLVRMKATSNPGWEEKRYNSLTKTHSDIIDAQETTRIMCTIIAFCGLLIAFFYTANANGAILYTCIERLAVHAGNNSTTLLTSMGILFTFFGLAKGFSHMEFDTSNVMYLEPLFQCLAIAFYTSMTGILTSIVVGFLLHIFTKIPSSADSIENQIKTLIGKIDKLTFDGFKKNIDYINESIIALQSQCENVNKLSNVVHNTNEEALIAARKLTTFMQNVYKPLSDFIETVNDASTETSSYKKILNDIKRSLHKIYKKNNGRVLLLEDDALVAFEEIKKILQKHNGNPNS